MTCLAYRYLHVLLGACALALGASAGAVPGGFEMVIWLKDGRVFTVPASPDDGESITFSDETPGAKGASPPVARDLPAAPEWKPGQGRILRVGPGERFPTPSAAARAARDGEVVEIAAGTYEADVAVWTANNLTLRGVGGRAVLDSLGHAAQGKGIWVIRGDKTLVENIEFANCKVPDRNCAGIRHEGTDLTARNCVFRDNEMGILAGRNPENDILIESSEFARNTVDYLRYGALGHNIYVGAVRSFTLRYSYVHGAAFGHLVKSRARLNRILYNRIVDGADGMSSYAVDLPNGGTAYVIGNAIHQGRRTNNHAVVSFGTAERSPSDRLYVVHNTIVNDFGSGLFVQNRSAGPALVANNILAGAGTPLTGPGSLQNNLIAGLPGAPPPGSDSAAWPATGGLRGNLRARYAGLAQPASFDYRLVAASPAVDAAEAVFVDGAEDLTPTSQYGDPLSNQARGARGGPDIGAYERPEQ